MSASPLFFNRMSLRHARFGTYVNVQGSSVRKVCSDSFSCCHVQIGHDDPESILSKLSANRFAYTAAAPPGPFSACWAELLWSELSTLSSPTDVKFLANPIRVRVKAAA